MTEISKSVQELGAKYGLSNLRRISLSDQHELWSGSWGQQPMILKVSSDQAGLTQESRALHAFSGFGVVKILAEQEGMLILERLVPGLPLSTYFPEKDREAIQITCGCLQRLHQAPLPRSSVFPHVQEWLAVLDQDWEIPETYLEKARRLRDVLLSSSAPEVFLHGDLHQDNILYNGQAWVVIDPKGVIGEPAYEVGAFIRNPMPELLDHPAAAHLILDRIQGFSDGLGLPRQRLLEWSFVQAVLAWVWALQDGVDTDYFRRLTTVLELLMA